MIAETPTQTHPTPGASQARELVVISGKGGTGKTSVVASFAALAEQAVLADGDVEASDLHLVLAPRVQRREDFTGGRRAKIDPAQCLACGICAKLCRFEAILFNGPGHGDVARTYRVDDIGCEGCGVCAEFCPNGAASMTESVGGEWFVSETRYGPMVHARLSAGHGNSGKLVNIVRDQARCIASETGRTLIVVDGPPGIGCPVIASITGASLALVVTEPTPSGIHDLLRVLKLAKHFDLPAAVCVNKWDLNPALTEHIERESVSAGAHVAGRISYCDTFNEAQRRGRAVVENGDSRAAREIRQVWATLQPLIS
ncbi:MAG: ATP-binding protein [Verrucomicrobiia bacterium]